MRTHLLAALLAASLATAVPAADAAPPVAGVDTPCSAESGNDPTAGPDVYAVNLRGGPIAQSGMLRCYIQVNGVQTSASASATSSTGSTTVPTSVQAFTARQTDDTRLCSQFVDASGQTYNYDGVAKQWSTNQVPCEWHTVGTVAVPSPPPGAAFAAMSWSLAPPSLTPTFTAPAAATSDPPNWSCTTSFPATGHARAVCEPVAGQAPPAGFSGWGCYVPATSVQVQDQPLTPGGTVTGATSCGPAAVGCSAVTGPTAPADACSDQKWAPQLVPVVCEAFYGSAAPGAAWTVRCGPAWA